MTKINGCDRSGYSSIAFNSVLKPWHRYYTVITPNSTVLYCNALYTALGAPLSPCGTFGSSGSMYCTLLYFTVCYCTLLYSTLMYCTVSYCSEGLPSAHVASLVALGPCTVLYCTLLYFTTVLYCTLLLSLPPHPMLHLNIKSRKNPCCGFTVMVDFIWIIFRRTNGRTDGQFGGRSKI